MIDRYGLRGMVPVVLQFHGDDGRPRRIGSSADMRKFPGLRGTLNAAWFHTRCFRFARRFEQFQLDEDLPELTGKSAADAFRARSAKFRALVIGPLTCGQANAAPELAACRT